MMLFSLLMALAIGLGVAGFIIDRSGAKARALGDRLRRAGRNTGEEGPRLDVERDHRYSAIPAIDKALRSFNVGEALELLLYQAGLTMRPGVLVTLVAACAMGGYLLGVVVFHRLMPGLLFMVLLTPVPYLYVVWRKSRRMNAFRNNFPDALDLLVSGLRAGLSFTAAMQIVSEESAEPVRSEFAITIEEQALGLDMREAMENLTRRVDVVDLRFFVTAVLLQRETGGNLAEVLSNAASLIRDRFRVLGDIQTFTAQGKLTAVILVCLPVGVGLFTYLITPDYFRPMIASDGGKLALWVAGWMQAAGCFVIYRIVNIRV